MEHLIIDGAIGAVLAPILAVGRRVISANPKVAFWATLVATLVAGVIRASMQGDLDMTQPLLTTAAVLKHAGWILASATTTFNAWKLKWQVLAGKDPAK